MMKQTICLKVVTLLFAIDFICKGYGVPIRSARDSDSTSTVDEEQAMVQGLLAMSKVLVS